MSKKGIVLGVICSLFVCFTIWGGTACELRDKFDSSENLNTEAALESIDESSVDNTNKTDVSSPTTDTSEATDETAFEADDFSFENRFEKGDAFTINYPIFISQKFSEYQDNFNNLLKEYAFDYWKLPEEGINYSVSYEITGYNAHWISILYSISIDGNNHIQRHSLNLSLISGNTLYLMESMEEGVNWNASCLWDGDVECEIITEGVSNQALSEYLQSEYPDYETFLSVFCDADNTSFISDYDLFWTFLSDEGIIVLIPVSHEMGDYVEVKMLIGG